MDKYQINLPSNKKSEIFFSLIFICLAIYTYVNAHTLWAYIFVFLAIFFILTSIFFEVLLLPLNRGWANLGLTIGKVANPLILGMVYFGLFTSIAFLMRIFGRDELKLKKTSSLSYWLKKENKYLNGNNSFENQF